MIKKNVLPKTLAGKSNQINRTLGANIRRFRRKSNMTLAELAKGVGVSAQQLQKYETGVTRISGAILVLLAEKLMVPLASLFPSESPRSVQPQTDTRSRDELLAEINRSFADIQLDGLRAVSVLAKAMRP